MNYPSAWRPALANALLLLACAFSSGCIATTAVVDNYIQRPPLIHRVETVEGAWLGSDGQLVVQWTSAVVPSNAEHLTSAKDKRLLDFGRYFALVSTDLDLFSGPERERAYRFQENEIPLRRIGKGKAPSTLLRNKKKLVVIDFSYYFNNSKIQKSQFDKAKQQAALAKNEEFVFQRLHDTDKYLGTLVAPHSKLAAGINLNLKERWLEPYPTDSKVVGAILLPFGIVADVALDASLVALGATVVVLFVGTLPIKLLLYPLTDKFERVPPDSNKEDSWEQPIDKKVPVSAEGKPTSL